MAMGFGRKNMEEIKTEEIKVWECSSETCNAWIRDNFKSTPKCPICSSEMVENIKELQVVNNNSIYSK
ncbi:cold-inducible protein YdjO-related protein [Cytobacillus purgationiresistens]|uniref:ABC-type ATPase with predicted acetyltransferase domain n=1 Tax=Cytobacillus purgationiresistens TaxID=863449 RepID=A0ABU0AGS6_9BACI|nr:cold-inducible protein YdjO-related protein [Cytobacillus purgationiresistens]MDQ0270463.1 ABC-type ATPase with predicted acetyltransferase domain [Cytobacillus purgationiresistens]